MALVHCKECEQEISDKATSCHKCGVPIDFSSESVANQISDIQLTRKSLKLQSFISKAMVIIGLVMVLFTMGQHSSDASELPSLILTVGIIWNVVNRIRTWWNHA
jgi:uncharacterized membrane protein YvbJ